MLVKISDIPEHGLQVEGEILPEEMDLHELSFSVDASFGYRLFLQIVNGIFIAKGSYNGVVNFICDRCLENFSHNPASDDYMYAVETSALIDETIDLTDGVREDIFLGLPIKVLCSEDCKGICPGCGANLNKEKCTCPAKPPESTPFSELDKLL